MHKLEGMLGLCVRAGRAAFGSEECVRLARIGKLDLVIVAEDASENTKKRMRDKCTSFGVPQIYFGTVSSLAHATGKGKVSVIGIRDKGFATAILKIYGGGFSG